MKNYKIEELTRKVSEVLQQAGASEQMAQSTAAALVAAEAQGLGSHGLARVKQYAGHLRSGRVNGQATPAVLNARGGAVLINADEGLAFPACELAVQQAIQRARDYGVAFAGVTRSHHFGPAGVHLAAAAEAGMVGLAFSNSPAAMPAWGGKRALFGTNPVAAVFPRRGNDPVCIDLSLSEVARGKLMVATQKGEPIPDGWALDKHGMPTNDPKAGLEGMMCPAGGVKGAMLALMVELLCVSLTGAALGFEADTFFQQDGNRPHIGHAFIVIDPSALAGSELYNERIETLIDAMLADDDVRLPGMRRWEQARRSEREGIDVADGVLEL